MSPPPTKAAEVAARLAWVETVALDRRSSALSIRLSVILSSMMGSAGYAFPSYDALAAISGASRKAVIETIAKLVACGHLTVERDPRPGRSRVNRYRYVVPSDQQPVWARWRAWKQSRTGDPSAEDEESPFSEKGSPAEDGNGHPKVTRTLERNPGTEPGSDPNGSAAAHATASLSREWKGSDGEPLPRGFPDDQAMRAASSWADAAGVTLDLPFIRRTFLDHHFAVRCKLPDWDRSWEMWVDTAIDTATGAAA